MRPIFGQSKRQGNLLMRLTNYEELEQVIANYSNCVEIFDNSLRAHWEGCEKNQKEGERERAKCQSNRLK